MASSEATRPATRRHRTGRWSSSPDSCWPMGWIDLLSIIRNFFISSNINLVKVWGSEGGRLICFFDARHIRHQNPNRLRLWRRIQPGTPSRSYPAPARVDRPPQQWSGPRRSGGAHTTPPLRRSSGSPRPRNDAAGRGGGGVVINPLLSYAGISIIHALSIVHPQSCETTSLQLRTPVLFEIQDK